MEQLGNVIPSALIPGNCAHTSHAVVNNAQLHIAMLKCMGRQSVTGGMGKNIFQDDAQHQKNCKYAQLHS